MIKNIIKHTPDTFCQGLLYHNGILYESSGLYEKSFIQKYLSPDKVIRYYFEPNIFIEGLTILNDILICFSWQNSDIFYFDLDFNLIKRQKFVLNESWGLCNDGKTLIVSDGSDIIYYINPNTLEIERKIKTEYKKINALCYANHLIYANIYGENIIICIDPKQNKVVKKWDFDYLFSSSNKYKLKINSQRLDKSIDYNILNGITYIPEQGLFYITGKNWNHIYVVELK